MTDGPTTPPPTTPTPGGPPGGSASLVDRAKNILLTPKTEWSRIDAEPATVAGLFTGYAMILAAIGPVATIIGLSLIGFPIGYALASAVTSYILALVTVFVVSLVIDALAPSFGGTKNQVQATKVAVYSSTPVWVIGILAIVPQLLALVVVLALVALAYGVYILYLGLPRLMRVAEDKAVGYVVVVVVAWVVINIVFTSLLTGIILNLLGFGLVTGGPAVRY